MAKLIVVLCYLVYLINSLNCSPSLRMPSENELLHKWNTFKTVYRLRLRASDEQSRFLKFKSNYLKVLTHNHDYSQNKSTYRVKLNEFSSMDSEEFKKYYLTKIPNVRPNNTDGIAIEELPVLQDQTTDMKSLKNLDWRIFGATSPVKHQRSCGACWAFAATGAIEALYNYRYGKSISLSEQQLVDCTRSGSYLNWGCDGGYPSNALYYAYSNGIVENSIYPYIAQNNYCQNTNGNMKFKVKGYGAVPLRDEIAMQKIVATYGPVTVAIDASDFGFTSYSDGVYSSNNCNENTLNHAVLVVGYGTTKSGNDYWIVKNSWGRNWGKDGYIYMARNQGNMCGIASLAHYTGV